MADICELLLVVMFAGLLCRVECVLVCVFWVCFGWRWWFSVLVVFVWRVGQFVTAESVWFSLVVVLLVGLVWCLRCEFPLFVGRLRVGVLAGLRLVVCVGLVLSGIVQFRGIGFCSRGLI